MIYLFKHWGLVGYVPKNLTSIHGFLVRGYPKDLIGVDVRMVKLTSKIEILRQANHWKWIIKEILYMDNEFKRVFTPKPMISFRNVRSLSSYLVGAKLYPTERTIGCYREKRCDVCIDINEALPFASTVTRET